jgi:hypothetical protein
MPITVGIDEALFPVNGNADEWRPGRLDLMMYGLTPGVAVTPSQQHEMRPEQVYC